MTKLRNNHVINGSTKITATVALTGTTYTATVRNQEWEMGGQRRV